MRRSRGLAALTIVGISAVVATCVYPTEHDSAVQVDLTHIAILPRRNDTAATATAWRILGAADSQPIPNAVFTWSSSNSTVATVDAAGHTVGITSGTLGISAA